MTMYIEAIEAIFSIEKWLSIKIPNKNVPKAVEKTINAVVIALMLPMCSTPYISAQVEDPKTLAKPFDIPIKPKKTNDEKGWLKKIKITIAKNKGKFIQGMTFLLVNLSTKKPEIKRDNIDIIE